MAFAEVPVCQFVPPWNFSPEKPETTDAEISKLLSKCVIVNTLNHVSGTFSRTKQNGNYRMFLNLKTFNAFLKFKHCKLESLEDALDLTTELVILGPSNPKMHPLPSLFMKISEIVLEGRILSIYCRYQWISTSSKSLYKCFDSSI